jgi:hypothetical protein
MQTPTLRQFFRHQLAQGFRAYGLAEPQALEYVSDILTRFAHTRALYALRDDSGRPLEHIVDMLVAYDQAARGRAREIVRHLGEYTLFMSGLFRHRLSERGELEYYLSQGTGAFWRCADAEPNPARRQLYRHVHQRFRTISAVLNDLRRVRWPLEPDGAARPDEFLCAFWRV